MKYRITAKTSTLGNPTSNVILEFIQQVLGNRVRTCNITKIYADEDEPWSGIFSAEALAILSKTNRLRVYIPGQLVFGRDMIITIKHNADWGFIRQKNKAQTNKDNIHKNRNQVDHDYKVGNKVVINNHPA